jgi:hypothetical protein
MLFANEVAPCTIVKGAGRPGNPRREPARDSWGGWSRRWRCWWSAAGCPLGGRLRPDRDELPHGHRSHVVRRRHHIAPSSRLIRYRLQDDRHRLPVRVRHVSGFFEPVMIEGSWLLWGNRAMNRLVSLGTRLGCPTGLRFSDFRRSSAIPESPPPAERKLKGSSGPQFVCCNRVPTPPPER